MRSTRNMGIMLLAVWLILTGVLPLLNIGFAGLGTIMNVLAIATGVLILAGI